MITITMLQLITLQNTEIPPNFLELKFCRNAQFSQSLGPVTQNSAEPVRFHKVVVMELL